MKTNILTSLLLIFASDVLLGFSGNSNLVTNGYCEFLMIYDWGAGEEAKTLRNLQSDWGAGEEANFSDSQPLDWGAGEEAKALRNLQDDWGVGEEANFSDSRPLGWGAGRKARLSIGHL